MTALVSAAGFEAARYQAGPVPQNQINAIGGGVVLVEAEVGAGGSVADVRVLRQTPPFTEVVVAAVGGWRFAPAEEETEPARGEPAGPRPLRPTRSKVLIAGMFRPPTLDNSPTIGETPRDVAAPSDEIPFPLNTPLPIFPVTALFDGVVLVEARVGTDGRVVDARVARSSPPFDGPSLDAIRLWSFRPARRMGTPVESYAYVVFGFRPPIVARPRR